MILECVLLSASLCHAVKDKPVMAMTAADTTMTILDMRQTERDFHRFPNGRETNPLIRPLLPHPAALYTYEAAGVLVESLLAHKLRKSSHRWIRDLWWVPQTIGLAGNVWGYAYTRIHEPPPHFSYQK